MRPPQHDFITPKIKQHALRECDVHEIVAKVHGITAKPEFAPLILTLIEQCLVESIRPEQAMMSLIQRNLASTHNTRLVFPTQEVVR
ncbi:hypothetical protein [Vibrio sp. 10N.261.46.A3]|uniref:hypothetical protein n=1 Tax=Vibrio sp. 10N.261.46.A3 TaxID=3229658 RepID=UPI0035502F3B